MDRRLRQNRKFLMVLSNFRKFLFSAPGRSGSLVVVLWKPPYVTLGAVTPSLFIRFGKTKYPDAQEI